MNKDELLSRSENLFSLPEVTIRLRELLDDKKSSVNDIAEVVTLDPTLTSKLLKLANSAFYSFASRIDTIPRALNIIGSDAVYSLALANSTVEAFNRVPEGIIDLEYFWRTSVDCALICKHLTNAASGNHAERMFVTGLLHNIGELLCVCELPESTKEISDHATGNRKEKSDFQKQVLGFTYTEISADFMQAWSFPKAIHDVVRKMETPSASCSPQDSAILSIASWLSLELAAEPDTGQKNTLEIIDLCDPGLLSEANVTPEMLAEAVEYANLEAINILSILSPKSMVIY